MNIEELFPRSKQRRDIAYSSLDVFQNLADYLPLTVRQVYYQLVTVGVVDNKNSQYKKVSVVLSEMREEGLFPYSYITDRSRRLIDKRGITDIQEFVEGQLEELFDPRYYHRCRVQEQQFYIEITTEKDALSAVIEEAVWPYCTRISVIRGQNSTTFVEQMAQRFKQAQELKQTPVMLHIGDFDPSGWRIPLSMQERLLDTHQVDVHLEIGALSPEQIIDYELPQNMDAAKQTDNNYGGWIRKFGINAKPVEVDALHPRDLRQIIVDALESFLDMDSFREQMEIEEDERNRLRTMRSSTIAWLNNQYPALVPHRLT